jgi:hypothetical protein
MHIERILNQCNHLVTLVTMDMSLTVYNLCITTQLKIQHKAKWKWNLSLYLDICVLI